MNTDLGTITKAAAEVIRLPVDFGDVPQLVAAASGGAPSPLVLSLAITSYTVTCVGTGAPAVSSLRLDYPYQISALFTGGTPNVGNSPGYLTTYTITLNDADGTTIVRTGYVRVI